MGKTTTHSMTNEHILSQGGSWTSTKLQPQWSHSWFQNTVRDSLERKPTGIHSKWAHANETLNENLKESQSTVNQPDPLIFSLLLKFPHKNKWALETASYYVKKANKQWKKKKRKN